MTAPALIRLAHILETARGPWTLIPALTETTSGRAPAVLSRPHRSTTQAARSDPLRPAPQGWASRWTERSSTLIGDPRGVARAVSPRMSVVVVTTASVGRTLLALSARSTPVTVVELDPVLRTLPTEASMVGSRSLTEEAAAGKRADIFVSATGERSDDPPAAERFGGAAAGTIV